MVNFFSEITSHYTATLLHCFACTLYCFLIRFDIKEHFYEKRSSMATVLNSNTFYIAFCWGTPCFYDDDVMFS